MHLNLHEFYHVYNRGNNQQPIFFSTANYLFFLKKIHDQLLPAADILCYCLMPNHFHLLIRANENSITERKSFGGKPMQEFAYRTGILLSSYTQAVNKASGRCGSLFQQKTKCEEITASPNRTRSSYLEDCLDYIHRNPVAAGIVKEPGEWPYSSYPDYAGLRNGTLCTKELFYRETGREERDFRL
ncbi:MAG TPA: hypothetical protein PKE63_09830 [Lacibacter sp.]|nr:hypothetical protein [Lacibacter sp.]HMO88597.1 hypothetical protein [Lacibacter sp.]HMP87565.1 hypothetical protein [Lacibacter sp.]